MRHAAVYLRTDLTLCVVVSFTLPRSCSPAFVAPLWWTGQATCSPTCLVAQSMEARLRGVASDLSSVCGAAHWPCRACTMCTLRPHTAPTHAALVPRLCLLGAGSDPRGLHILLPPLACSLTSWSHRGPLPAGSRRLRWLASGPARLSTPSGGGASGAGAVPGCGG